MTPFALYRMPYAQSCTLLSGQVQEVASCMELSQQQGFVVAPFAPSAKEPVLIIQPERVLKVVSKQGELSLSADDLAMLQDYTPQDVLPLGARDSARTNYKIDFGNFHSHLCNSDFQKLVLSRSITLERTEQVSPLKLFKKACEAYPRMFIALVSTPQSGCWLVSTPEVLLAGNDSQWQTVALAGTMAWDEQLEWSDKNRQEQRYVATYITEQLEQFTSNFIEEGPYTVRAGHLAHLRSDFRFSLPDTTKIGHLIATLHPTPAVCGLPKKAAFNFIQQNEHQRRSYYSGFMGALDVTNQTNLFVTLRCMRIYGNAYQLYAGGGLLKDSVEEQEWEETEAKLDTMRNIINHHV